MSFGFLVNGNSPHPAHKEVVCSIFLLTCLTMVLEFTFIWGKKSVIVLDLHELIKIIDSVFLWHSKVFHLIQ